MCSQACDLSEFRSEQVYLELREFMIKHFREGRKCGCTSVWDLLSITVGTARSPGRITIELASPAMFAHKRLSLIIDLATVVRTSFLDKYDIWSNVRKIEFHKKLMNRYGVVINKHNISLRNVELCFL